MLGRMYIAGRTQMMDRHSVYEALGRMKDLGFRGVELSLLDIRFHPRADLLDDFMAARIRERIESLGFDAFSVSCHGDFVFDDDTFALVKRGIMYARELGTDVFVFSGARSGKTEDPREQWKRMRDRTAELCRIAEDHGIRLAEEAEPGFICGNAAELVRLIGEIGSPALGCNMDIGHSFLCDPDPPAAIRELGDRIFHCHVENMRRGVHDHLLPHIGDMDLSSYFRTLGEIGFSGLLALDLYGYDYEEVAPDAIEYVESLISGAAPGVIRSEGGLRSSPANP